MCDFLARMAAACCYAIDVVIATVPYSQVDEARRIQVLLYGALALVSAAEPLSNLLFELIATIPLLSFSLRLLLNCSLVL